MERGRDRKKHCPSHPSPNTRHKCKGTSDFDYRKDPSEELSS